MILFWITVFFTGLVVAKTFIEIINTHSATFDDHSLVESQIHANQHMVYMTLFILHEIISLIAYAIGVYNMNMEEHVHYIVFVKVNFLNLVFLLVVNHFRQERLGEIKTVNIKDIFRL